MTVTKNFNNLDTDNTLGGNSPSDYRVSSQKAIKEYVDSKSSVSLTSGNGINIDADDNSIDLIQQDIPATEQYTWSDLTINSNLVNADNVISNFYNNRYITMPDEALTVTSSDEVVFQVKFKKTSFISTMDYLYCAAKTSSNADSGLVIYYNSDNLYVRIGNSSTNKLSYSGLSLNIFYTLNIQYKNGNLSGTITDENGTTQALTVVSSGATSLIISNIGRFGHQVRTGSGQYLRGAIDLNQTFIKVNDTLFYSTVTGSPAQIVAKATNTLYGLVKPDGTTITVNNGVISSSGRTLIESKKSTTSSPSWYNLYSDGYVEQGGEITVGNTTISQVTFSKEFENNKYMPILTCITYTAGNIDGLCHITELTTTGMKIFDASGRTYRWECKGYVATS